MSSCLMPFTFTDGHRHTVILLMLMLFNALKRAETADSSVEKEAQLDALRHSIEQLHDALGKLVIDGPADGQAYLYDVDPQLTTAAPFEGILNVKAGLRTVTLEPEPDPTSGRVDPIADPAYSRHTHSLRHHKRRNRLRLRRKDCIDPYNRCMENNERCDKCIKECEIYSSHCNLYDSIQNTEEPKSKCTGYVYRDKCSKRCYHHYGLCLSAIQANQACTKCESLCSDPKKSFCAVKQQCLEAHDICRWRNDSTLCTDCNDKCSDYANHCDMYELAIAEARSWGEELYPGPWHSNSFNPLWNQKYECEHKNHKNCCDYELFRLSDPPPDSLWPGTCRPGYGQDPYPNLPPIW